VEHSNAVSLSLSYTALLENNNKYKLHLTAVESKTLEDLPKVFTSTQNPHRNSHANKAFAPELEGTAYTTQQSLSGFLNACEGLIVEWQKTQYNEKVRGGKRKVQESERD
jgi:hypothetical protein